MEQYWDKNGNIHREGEKEANIAQKAYSALLSKLANINKQDALIYGMASLIPAAKGVSELQAIKPFLNEIWNGRNLFLTIPYNLKNLEQKINYAKEGEKYFKENLVNNPVETKWGTAYFVGNRANETDPKYIWQYPFTRYNLSKAINNTPFPNYKKATRPDTSYFDNVEVNMLGKKYDYQLRNSKSQKRKEFYNIKNYDKFKKDIERAKTQYPKIYQEYIDLLNKTDL